MLLYYDGSIESSRALGVRGNLALTLSCSLDNDWRQKVMYHGFSVISSASNDICALVGMVNEISFNALQLIRSTHYRGCNFINNVNYLLMLLFYIQFAFTVGYFDSQVFTNCSKNCSTKRMDEFLGYQRYEDIGVFFEK